MGYDDVYDRIEPVTPTGPDPMTALVIMIIIITIFLATFNGTCTPICEPIIEKVMTNLQRDDLQKAAHEKGSAWEDVCNAAWLTREELESAAAETNKEAVTQCASNVAWCH